jgi:hypothetical protein
MKGLPAAVAIAFLALAAHPGAPDRNPDLPRESHLAAAPVPQTSIVSHQGVVVRPVPLDATASVAETGEAALLDLRIPAGAEDRFLLISAQLREKYRSFRDSLTSP